MRFYFISTIDNLLFFIITRLHNISFRRKKVATNFYGIL